MILLQGPRCCDLELELRCVCVGIFVDSVLRVDGDPAECSGCCCESEGPLNVCALVCACVYVPAADVELCARACPTKAYLRRGSKRARQKERERQAPECPSNWLQPLRADAKLQEKNDRLLATLCKQILCRHMQIGVAMLLG